jgi:hypothetical protein
MHVVVNHLELKEPLPPETFASADALAQALVDAGGLGCHIVRVNDLHLILVLFFESAEEADRMARDIGGPWMREHVTPYLVGGTQRHLGEVVVSRAP